MEMMHDILEAVVEVAGTAVMIGIATLLIGALASLPSPVRDRSKELIEWIEGKIGRR